MLKMAQSINIKNLDTYLMPVNITATLQKFHPTKKEWLDVSWNHNVDSHYSNIKKFEYTNKETTSMFRYSIKICHVGNMLLVTTLKTY